jgi:hypothetical protein
MPIQKKRGMLARGERLQIMLSPDELTAVDDFRFKHRMPSRAAAVRDLFRLGLASLSLVNDGAGRKSADFGVLRDGDGSHNSVGG